MTTPPIGKPNLLIETVEGLTLKINWNYRNLIVSDVHHDYAFELSGSELDALFNELRQNVGEDYEHSCNQDCPCFEEGEDRGRERGEEDIIETLRDALDDEDVDLVQFVTNLVGR